LTPGRSNLRFQFRRHFDQRYNKTNSDCHHRSIVSLISLRCGNIARVPSALGQYSRNFGKLDSLLTSMPVTICILYSARHKSERTSFAYILSSKGNAAYNNKRYHNFQFRKQTQMDTNGCGTAL